MFTSFKSTLFEQIYWKLFTTYHKQVDLSVRNVLLFDLKLSIFSSQDSTILCFVLLQYSTSLADEARDNHAQQIERAEIANLVRSRMESLNLTGIDYDDVSEKRNSLSYVIINPSCDLNLQEGDIM